MAVIKKKRNFLEDLRIGHVCHHAVDETLPEDEFNAFRALDLTTNPLSKDTRDDCRSLVAPPGLVMKIVFSQSGRDRDDRAPRGTQRNRMGRR